jgi:hypothetical protein
MLPGNSRIYGNIIPSTTPIRPLYYPIHPDHFYATPAITGRVLQYASPPSGTCVLQCSTSKRGRDENTDPTVLATGVLSPGLYSPPKKKRKYVRDTRTVDDRLQVVFASIKEVKWNLSEFLYYTFQYREEDNSNIHRSQSHAAHVHPFLKGNSTHTPAEILHYWFTCPDGRGTEESDITLYLSVPYNTVKPVRAALY